MALRGKGKSSRRGSQGRRRPATAPRPVVTSAGRRLPWYHTNTGRVGLGIGIAIVVGLVWWIISSNQAENDRLEERRDALGEYTDQVQTLTQTVAQAGSELAGVPPQPDAAAVRKLEASSQNWSEAFTGAQASLVQVLPPSRSLQRVSGLFGQALQLFDSASQTYGLVPDADGRLRTQLLARAASLRDQASFLWTQAVEFLDAQRATAEMEASGLTAPTAGTEQPTSLPSPLPTPAETEGG